MKSIFSVIAVLAIASVSFAQDRVAVWTVPSPQTVEVSIIVNLPGPLVYGGQPYTVKTVSVDAPAGSTVSIVKAVQGTPSVQGVPSPAKTGPIPQATSCPCIVANGVCYCADPFQATQAKAPQGYRMVCDGNSCRLVPIGDSGMASTAFESFSDSGGASSGSARVGPFRRVIGRIFGGRKGGAGGGSCCGR